MALPDIGKLLRLQSMLNSAQVEATSRSGTALVAAYSGLVAEVRMALQADGLEELRGEFDRLFTPIAPPPRVNDREQALAATEALVKLKQAAGWVEGLIAEATLEQRIQAEAEAKVKLQSRPSTGFGS